MSRAPSNNSVERRADTGPADQLDEEQALIHNCVAGDTRSFAVLVERYRDRVYNVIYRMCRDHQEAEDLSQEAFLKAFEKLDRFRGGSRFYTWLFRIAVNLTLSRKRKTGRTRVLSLDCGREDGCRETVSAANAVPSRAAGPEKLTENAETAARISAAIAGLDEEFRAVVVLRDIEDMDYAEISAVLGIPAGTVKSRLFRGRKILQQQLTGMVD